MNPRNLCIFSSDGVFGNYNTQRPYKRWRETESYPQSALVAIGVFWQAL